MQHKGLHQVASLFGKLFHNNGNGGEEREWRREVESGFIYMITSIAGIALIGASLSEPQTSRTALHTCVCMLACGHIL